MVSIPFWVLFLPFVSWKFRLSRCSGIESRYNRREPPLVFLSISAFALTMSLIREISKRGNDNLILTVWKYLSYYTTLSNILVFVWFAALTLKEQLPFSEFADNPNIASAITFYIVTVGVANYLLFGWQELSLIERISDLLVHAITPIISLVYWMFFIDKEGLQHSFLAYWLIFPLAYAFYTILHGKWSQFYPYEFTNIQLLGYKKVLLNTFALSISLVIGGTLFIFLGQFIGRLQ